MSSRTVTVPAGFTIDYHDPTHTYKIDGVPVPSVSTVMNVLDKPALPWWGMKTGCGGVLELFERGKMRVQRGAVQVIWEATRTDIEKAARALAKKRGLKWSKIEPEARDLLSSEVVAKELKPRWETADQDRVVSALTRERLTTNHVRDDRGTHGTNAHKMFENWADMGVMPDPDQVDDDDEKGRVRALLQFCTDAAGTHSRRTEVIVGSKKHGFAGRYDLDCALFGELLTGLSPRRTRTFTGEPTLLDVKSSKSVYQSHFLQLEGYEGARLESGYAPTKYRVVIHLLPSGSYRLHRSTRTYAEFLACVPAVAVVKKPGTRW